MNVGAMLKERTMAKRGLRSRLSRYGDEEFALFLRRGFLKGAGYTDDALERPIVGVLSTASDFNPCHKTAPQVAEAVAKGVRLAGGLPFIFPTISLHEAFAGPSSLLLRNLMAMDVEEMVANLPLDAVVLIGGCDKTTSDQTNGNERQEKYRRQFASAERGSPYAHQRREGLTDACCRAAQSTDFCVSANCADERHAHERPHQDEQHPPTRRARPRVPAILFRQATTTQI